MFITDHVHNRPIHHIASSQQTTFITGMFMTGHTQGSPRSWQTTLISEHFYYRPHS